jgi:hypothetical protein
MLAAVKALAGPDGVEQGRRRMCGLAWGARRSPAQPAVVVSDEQIIALVAAARALSQRQRRRLAAVTSVEADERLLRLDWAVWAGRLVLAERAGARALAFATLPPARAAERRVDL